MGSDDKNSQLISSFIQPLIENCSPVLGEYFRLCSTDINVARILSAVLSAAGSTYADTQVSLRNLDISVSSVELVFVIVYVWICKKSYALATP